MRLRCPSCNDVEEITNLQGAWWATCGRCGHRIKVIGSISNKESDKITIQCPQCGYRENDLVIPSNNIQVACPACCYEWRLNSKPVNTNG